MKNIKKIIMSAVIGLSLLFSQEASAREFRSNHYHRGNQTQVVRGNHYYGQRHVREVRRVYQRQVFVPGYAHYRPYYRPVITHYYYPGFEPCDEVYETDGVSWNVSFGSGGIGIGVQSGW